MKVKRNTNGLKKAAQAKREKAFEDVDKGIQKLLKDGTPINFNRVSEASGVSKAWLYREPKVKERIEGLRAQSKQGKKLPRKISATEASTKALNATLQVKVKKLEAENRELRRQNEVAYGQVIRLREIEKQLERVTAENKRLKSQELGITASNSRFDTELEALDVRLNSTLQRLIQGTPESIVQSAVRSLQEAQKTGKVKNPGGFLNAAIRDAWEPNANLQENDELTKFNEWWPEARAKGFVVGSEQVDGVIYIYTANGERLTFKQASCLYQN